MYHSSGEMFAFEMISVLPRSWTLLGLAVLILTAISMMATIAFFPSTAEACFSSHLDKDLRCMIMKSVILCVALLMFEHNVISQCFRECHVKDLS